MKTKTIGELLAGERAKKNLSIEQLKNLTKITPKYLIALEANQFEVLPSATFVKGFIKSLAHVYGLDPQPLLALLRRDFKESADDRLVPHEFIRPALKHQPMWTPVITTIVFLSAIFLTLISYVMFQWYSLQKPPELTLDQPTDAQEVSSTFKIQGKTVPDAIVAVNAQPIAVFPDGSFESELTLPREGTHLLTVESTDKRGKKSVIQRVIKIKMK